MSDFTKAILADLGFLWGCLFIAACLVMLVGVNVGSDDDDDE